MKRKSQVLMFTLIMMLVAATLSQGLLSMWEPVVQITARKKASLQAFYLAQAAIEMAKAKTDANTTTHGWWGSTTTNTGLSDIDCGTGSNSGVEYWPGCNTQFPGCPAGNGNGNEHMGWYQVPINDSQYTYWVQFYISPQDNAWQYRGWGWWWWNWNYWGMWRRWFGFGHHRNNYWGNAPCGSWGSNCCQQNTIYGFGEVRDKSGRVLAHQEMQDTVDIPNGSPQCGNSDACNNIWGGGWGHWWEHGGHGWGWGHH